MKENNCWTCEFKENIPGNCHIKCLNPDPEMIGNKHGIRNGWFLYPWCFDPIWMEKKCNNFKLKIK